MTPFGGISPKLPMCVFYMGTLGKMVSNGVMVSEPCQTRASAEEEIGYPGYPLLLPLASRAIRHNLFHVILRSPEGATMNLQSAGEILR